MNYSDIDLNKLKITNDILEYDGKRGLHIKTPNMRIPFGLDEEYGKYILRLEFSDLYSNDEMNGFYKFIKTLENIFKKHFGNSGTFKSLIRLNKTYEPLFCPKIMERYNRLECDK